MATNNPLSAVFGKSPFKPMQEHMRVVIDCVGHVPDLFQALVDDDQAALDAAKKKIYADEEKADAIKNALRGQLPKSFLMPVDRNDILELLAVQDAIADTAQDIAGLLLERRMEVPADMAKPLLRFVGRCVDACRQSHRVIEELDELLEIGFRGPRVKEVEAMIVELRNIESDTDDMGTKLVRQLFAQEDSMKPVSVMFWYQLLQWIGDLADYAETVGDRLHVLIAR
jgi:predicted phosphate transport protein (TIGR00153 family)